MANNDIRSNQDDDEIVVVSTNVTSNLDKPEYSCFNNVNHPNNFKTSGHGPFHPHVPPLNVNGSNNGGTQNFIKLAGTISERNKRKNIRHIHDGFSSGAMTAQMQEQERLNRKRKSVLTAESYMPVPIIELNSDEETEEDDSDMPEFLCSIRKNDIKEIKRGPGRPRETLASKASSRQARQEEQTRLERQSQKKQKDPESTEKNAQGKLLVNHDRAEGEPEVFVADHLTDILRPHQLGGIRFMYDNIIESVNGYKDSSGYGCVLAHSMGLGKTIQVIGFIEIFFKTVNPRNVLILTPVNVIQNWKAEFDKWLPIYDNYGGRLRNFEIFMVGDNTKTFEERRDVILRWKRSIGVLLMGYDMFRILFQRVEKQNKVIPSKKVLQQTLFSIDENGDYAKLRGALVDPGPDLVVCDEGHKIKCLKTNITNALNQVRTRRRIVLTGYPLQNNLVEYYCMVNFVRPDFLGTKSEFSATFDRPIKNGQCLDSTPSDIKLAQIKIHTLSKLLKGFVQRRSALLLKKILPENREYVIVVRKTPIQRELYRTFSAFVKLDMYYKSSSTYSPLKAHAIGTKIWNHPDLLYAAYLKKLNEWKNVNNGQQQLQMDGSIGEAAEKLRLLRTNQDDYFRVFETTKDQYNRDYEDDPDNYPIELTLEWAGPIFENYRPMIIENSNKMIITFDIIRETVALGEKLLVFSSSVVTLNLLEKFLSMQRGMVNENNKEIHWMKNYNYCRFDGTTPAVEREKLIDRFNSNPGMYLFFISTKAGSLGINLVSANRIIIMDACWNPCHDAQAVCRVYRYGQQKRTYVYRLIMQNSMENSIFYRQISKHGLQQRVVDEKQCVTNVTQAQLENLLKYDESLDIVSRAHDLNEWQYDDSVLMNIIPKDAELMSEKPFLHDSMITETENTLSEEEKLEVELLVKQETLGNRIVNNRIHGGSINIRQDPIMPNLPNEMFYHNNIIRGSASNLRGLEYTEFGLNRTQFQIRPSGMPYEMPGPSTMNSSTSMPNFNNFQSSPLKHPLHGNGNGMLYKMNNTPVTREVIADSFAGTILTEDIVLPTRDNRSTVQLYKGDEVRIMRMSGRTYLKKISGGEILDATGTKYDPRIISQNASNEVIQIDD